MDEESRHEFYQFFKEASTIYDILSPDSFLRPYLEDIETLARMYRILREAYEPGIKVDKDFSRKTAQLVQKHTKGGAIKKTLEVYEINEDTLRKIEESKVSDTEKIFNLIKSIGKVISDNIGTSPYLISIGEKAELLIKLYKERQTTTQRTLDELKKLIEEMNAARREQSEKNMPAEVFSIFWLLKNEDIDNPEDKANLMRGVLEKYPHWKTSEKHNREVKQELYKVLLQAGIKDTQKIAKMAQNLMRVIKGGPE